MTRAAKSSLPEEWVLPLSWSKKTPGLRCIWETMTRSVPLTTKVPFSVMKGHPLHDGGDGAYGGGRADGGMGVEQQVVADRRSRLGGANSQLRNTGGAFDLPGGADDGHAADAGNH